MEVLCICMSLLRLRVTQKALRAMAIIIFFSFPFKFPFLDGLPKVFLGTLRLSLDTLTNVSVKIVP